MPYNTAALNPASTATPPPSLRDGHPAPHQHEHAGEADNQSGDARGRRSVAKPDERHERTEERRRRIQHGGKSCRHRQHGVREQRERDRRVDGAEKGQSRSVAVKLIEPAAAAPAPRSKRCAAMPTRAAINGTAPNSGAATRMNRNDAPQMAPSTKRSIRSRVFNPH